MRLDSEGAAELLNEYYDELHDTVTNMKDLQKNYDKLTNLNKCNMNMLRREMTDWGQYYRLQIEETKLLADTREAELKEAKDNLKKTLDENKQLKETNSKLERAINNERMKLKKYIQQNIQDRIRQMTNGLSLPEEPSPVKSKSNPTETFLKNKHGTDKETLSSTPRIVRNIDKTISVPEIKQVKTDGKAAEFSVDSRSSEQKHAVPAHIPPSKKPKVFLGHSQAWDGSTSFAPEKVKRQTLKNRKTEMTRHQSQPAIKHIQSCGHQEEKKPEKKQTDIIDVKDTRSSTLKKLKAKEYEDVSLSGCKVKKQPASDAQSLDEPLKSCPGKEATGKIRLFPQTKFTKVNKH